ncbi:MAG: GNAT family N-acetyltransferase [Burkholderiaceae bacterium]|nr:GNAT family N-acetyltransferase [Burkholderiaceae bacterium]
MLRFDTLRLDTPRLRLRPLRPDDAPAVYALHADPVALRYWSTPPWDDPAQADELIGRDLKALAEGDYLRLGLQRHADGRLIGLCSLFAFHLPSRRCELGYLLQRGLWGQGLMHEALLALLDYGFGVLDLNRIEADIDPRNAASRRSLERLGFAEEGRLRERWIVAGEVSDTALYGLLRRDWAARVGAPLPRRG